MIRHTPLYIWQLLGSVFGSRDSVLIRYLGAAIFFIWAGFLFRFLVRRDKASSILRSGHLLCFASLLFLLAFAVARQQYGIDWALGRFHAAPLARLFYVGLGFCLIDGLDRSEGAAGTLTFYGTVLAGLLVSVGTAVPYALARAPEQALERAVAMARSCAAVKDEKKIVAISIIPGFSDPGFVMRNLPLLNPLCTTNVPSYLRPYISTPLQFTQMELRHPEMKDALEDLWFVYQLHPELQAKFQISDPNMLKQLLELAHHNAETHQSMQHEFFDQHSELFRNLKIDSAGF
jgi:hypothetical protein